MPGDTHTCENCGGGEHNPNPLDQCGRDAMQCDNPCRRGPKNSPQCESLPSQIQNFSDQFFGTVVKTEINGQVRWSLPCGLDIGLPGNPRGVDEGLACYFLRLFNDGIGGLKGDAGAPGAPGTPGNNAYSVVTQGFTQPTLANPLVQFVIAANPAIVAGIGVFLPDSGYYTVSSVSSGGVVFATLVQPVASPVTYVAAGTLVIPSGIGAPGIPGKDGARGAQGAQGAAGPQGDPFTRDSGKLSFAYGSTDFLITGTNFVPVTFGAQNFSFVLGNAGTYLVTVNIVLKGTSTDGVHSGINNIRAKLINVTAAGLGQPAEVAGSISGTILVYSAAIGWSEGTQLSMTAVVPLTAANQLFTVYLQDGEGFGYTSAAGYGSTATWVQIA